MEHSNRSFASGLLPAGAARKTLVSLLFCTLVAALHFLYLISGQCVCIIARTCTFTVDNAEVFSFSTFSAVDASDSAIALRPRYNSKFRDEEVESGNFKLRKLWTSKGWRIKVGIFSDTFQDIMNKNLLKPCDRALCIGAGVGHEVLALREVGVRNSIGIDLVASPPLVMKGDMHRQPFKRDTFDFEFSSVFDHALFTSMFAAEIERTLKPGGCIVIHLMTNNREETYRPNNLLSVDILITLFKNFDLVHVGEIDALGLDTEIVFRKRFPSQKNYGIVKARQKPRCSILRGSSGLSKEENTFRKCSVSDQIRKIVNDAEPNILEKALTHNMNKIKYLPHTMDISMYGRHYFFDVGTRDFDPRRGSWFQKEYPTQNQSFLTYVVQADKAYSSELTNRPNAKMIRYAAWIRNESLLMGSSQQPELGTVESATKQSLLRILVRDSAASNLKRLEAGGFDFAEWLEQTVSLHDFVVLKMDVEGTEFDLLPRMLETGAICLVDELFLECHHHDMQRSLERTSEYDKTFDDCTDLFNTLRGHGVLVHQWWG